MSQRILSMPAIFKKGGNGGGITKGWELIVDTVVVGNVTSVTVAGLDINTDEAYHIIIDFEAVGAVGYQIYMHVNNDLVVANYWRQQLVGNAGAATANRVNSAFVGWVAANNSCLLTIDLIRDRDGYPRALAYLNREAPASIILTLNAWIKTATVANITRLDFVSSAANQIKAGSRLLIFRVVT